MHKKIIFGVLISGILIYLSARGINFTDVVQNFKQVQFSYAFLFLVVIIFMQWLRSYRWGIILKPMEKIDQLSLFSVTSVGFLAITAIPARLGELARPYLIAQKSSIKMSSALGTIIVERALDSFSILSIAVVVIFLSNLPSWMIKSSIILFFMAMFILCGIVGLTWRRETALKIINWFFGRLPGKFAHRIDDIIHRFIDGFQIITNLRLLAYLFFISVAVWLINVLAIYLLLNAFGFSLPAMAAFVVMIILIAGIALPAAPGFIGSWHYSCILALSLFGVDKASGLSFAVLYHFLSIAIVIILGVIFLPFNKFSFAEIKKELNQNR